MEITVYIILSLVIGFCLGHYIANMNSTKILASSEDIIQKEKDKLEKIKEEMEKSFKAIASDVSKSNTEQFLKLANDKFQSLSKESNTNLEQKKKLIDHNLEEMAKKLDFIQKQSTELNTNLEFNKEETRSLRDTTAKLREILSSSQTRGQWGERMVEDILKFIGLMENVNYRKQAQVESGQRPDFTFILPKEKTINMDVKFPLAHYERYIESNDSLVKENEKKDFLKDVREHIKTISTREYIDPSSGTLDYVLMFIPNESIYSFINQEGDSIIDFALEKKVLLCSPLTLYAILSLINQATHNFAIEEQASDVMRLLSKFKDQWGRYMEMMDKMGRSIQSVQNDYEQLVTTRRRQLEKPMGEIESISDKIKLPE